MSPLDWGNPTVYFLSLRQSPVESTGLRWGTVKYRMKDTLEEAKAALAKAKDNMMLYYNWVWSPAPEFKMGDMVFLNASDIQTTRPSKKLSH